VVSAEAAADLGLARDGEQLTGQLGFLVALGHRKRLLCGPLERVRDRVDPEGAHARFDLPLSVIRSVDRPKLSSIIGITAMVRGEDTTGGDLLFVRGR
jgi:hypothetical protein